MENLIVGMIALLLFAYLLVAMLRPEKFIFFCQVQFAIPNHLDRLREAGAIRRMYLPPVSKTLEADPSVKPG